MPVNSPTNLRPETLTLSRKSRLLSKVIPRLHGTAQWTALMRNFSQTNQDTCKSVIRDIPQMERSMKMFPTGSTYLGAWNQLGISGEGTYSFPRPGVVYKGGFYDGEFHGDGELQYADGSIMKGKWNMGTLVEKHLFFPDGLEYAENDWAYCRPYDRRFTIENNEGLLPSGRSYMTAEQPSIQIPPNQYDVGTGFYDPVSKIIYKYDDCTSIARLHLTHVVDHHTLPGILPGMPYNLVMASNNDPYKGMIDQDRAAKEHERQWIENNCRVNPDLPKGPCPFLYEDWLIPDLDMPLAPRPRIHYGPLDNYDDFDEFEKLLEKHSTAGIYASRTGFGVFYDPTKPQRKESTFQGVHGSVAKPHRDFIAFSKKLVASRSDLGRDRASTGKWGMSGQSCSKKSSIFIPRASVADRSRSLSVSVFASNPFSRKSIIDSSSDTRQSRSASEPRSGHRYSRKSESDESRPTSESVNTWAPSFVKKTETDPGVAATQSDSFPVKATMSDTAIIDKNINSWRAIHKEVDSFTSNQRDARKSE